jgi:hypothetical protein
VQRLCPACPAPRPSLKQLASWRPRCVQVGEGDETDKHLVTEIRLLRARRMLRTLMLAQDLAGEPLTRPGPGAAGGREPRRLAAGGGV